MVVGPVPASEGLMALQTNSPAELSAYPSARYGWYITILLTLIYILSFVDRQVLSILVEPIKADLQISDTRMGLLMGAAFAIFYGTMGLPLGWLADRVKRKYVLGSGITVWSAATIASGFAQGFNALFGARVLVGAGEASLGPCAYSLISDVMPPQRRARAIAVYSSALSFAMATAYFLGGRVLAWAEAADFSGYPIISYMRPWQIVFVIVGAPGILAAILVLLMREPKRLDLTPASRQPITFVLGYFRHRIWVYVALFTPPTAMTIISYTHLFTFSLFSRLHGWEPTKLSVYLGAILITIGPLSTFFGGWLVDRKTNAGQADGGIQVMRLGLLVMVPNAALFPIMPTPELTLLFYALCTIGMTILTAAAVPSILTLVPAHIRGQSTALYLMIISIFGLILGPTLVGVFNDYVFQDELKIGYSMTLVAVAFGGTAILALPWIVRLYRGEIAALQNQVH